MYIYILQSDPDICIGQSGATRRTRKSAVKQSKHFKTNRLTEESSCDKNMLANFWTMKTPVRTAHTLRYSNGSERLTRIQDFDAECIISG